ncbi:MAG: hypothetical protein V3U71_02275 [Cocleimonas sp.]
MRYTPILIALALSINLTVVADETTDAIKAAKLAQKEAIALGFEWRDMGITIKKSEKAAKAGKHQKAIKLAKIISGQIKAIRKQAAIAKSAGPKF